MPGSRASWAVPTGKKQRKKCAPPASVSDGSDARQESRAYRHRGANLHPGGGAVRSGGWPGMLYSRLMVDPSAAFSGSASNSASVYGWRGRANSTGVGAISTIRPAYITATRSARPAITPRSCVTRITAMASRCRSESISSRICFWMVTSRAVVGSSAISSFGSQASAMAIITRCRMPPDSWCG